MDANVEGLRRHHLLHLGNGLLGLIRCNEKKNHQNSDQTPPGKDLIQQTFQSIHETTSFHLAEPAFMSSSVC
jgi:hypothetical protein